jgi:hypothetical protein
VVCVLRDKDWRGILRAVARAAERIVVTMAPTAPANRTWDLHEVDEWARGEGLPVARIDDFSSALAQARAEEAVLDTHVRNALLYVDTLAGELPFDRAIETYIRMLGVPEPLASTVATRTLVVLGDDVVPERHTPLGTQMVGDDVLPIVQIAAATDTGSPQG